jgi:hypothetical protein
MRQPIPMMAWFNCSRAPAFDSGCALAEELETAAEVVVASSNLIDELAGLVVVGGFEVFANELGFAAGFGDGFGSAGFGLGFDLGP